MPRAIASFGGKFDTRKLTFPYNLVQALKSMPASDVRDWTAICAWASDLATQFQPALAWTSELRKSQRANGEKTSSTEPGGQC